jgi:hypothetical protein
MNWRACGGRVYNQLGDDIHVRVFSLNRLMKTEKKTEDIRCPVRVSNRASPKNKSEALHPEPLAGCNFCHGARQGH